jgi:gamma-glutamylcyclotransferase (GGCT)/AIG2-like uncharacterized protein YtfP
MEIDDLVFVYGSLRRGETADLSMRSGSEFIGEDTINGKLYGVSWFPGVKDVNTTGFDPSCPVVHGEVYRLKDKGLIRHLDAYEGYPDLYDRVQVETGNSRFVWVYTYNYSVADNQRVMSGDWLNPTLSEEAA